MKIHIADSSYALDSEFVEQYCAEIEAAFARVSALLPFGSQYVNFFVQPREYALIPESQDNGHAHNSEFIEMAFNPTVDAKALALIVDNVWATVFHEMHHAARFNLQLYHTTFLDNCVLEGLATAFERDYCNSQPPYGVYSDDVKRWIDEIMEQNDGFDWQAYTFDHPDGRRWIAYKVGTYIVDEAKQKSGKTVIELTELESVEIIRLAGIDTSQYRGLSVRS